MVSVNTPLPHHMNSESMAAFSREFATSPYRAFSRVPTGPNHMNG
nr:hypothetical protein Q903MT_gene928 [Picea sitchensis]